MSGHPLRRAARRRQVDALLRRHPVVVLQETHGSQADLDAFLSCWPSHAGVASFCLPANLDDADAGVPFGECTDDEGEDMRPAGGVAHLGVQ